MPDIKERMTLQPGYLVALSVRCDGGIKYTRVDLDADKKEGDTAAVERWETTKVVDNPEEHQRARKVQSKCGSIIRSVCTHTAFGLLCPEAKLKQLQEAITEAKSLADKHNSSEENTTTTIGVYVMLGKVAQTDQEAARAIASEMRALVDEMEAGIGAGNVDAARKAASEALKMGKMLDEATNKKVSAAVEEVRAAAKEMTRKIMAGEDRAAVVAKIKLDAVKSARFAFLDMDAPAPAGERLPGVAARVVDLENEEEKSDKKSMLQKLVEMTEEAGGYPELKPEIKAAAPVSARELEL